MYDYDGNTTDTYPANGKTFIANTSSISRHLNANGFATPKVLPPASPLQTCAWIIRSRHNNNLPLEYNTIKTNPADLHVRSLPLTLSFGGNP